MARTASTKDKTTETTESTATTAKAKTEDKNIVESQKQNEQLQAMLANLQNEINNIKTSTTTVSSTENLTGKRIKIISLSYNPINISTEEDGRGMCITFNKFGDSRMVTYDTLSLMVFTYPNTFRSGLIYIADKEAVNQLDLSDAYAQNVYDKETIKKITNLENDVYVDMFINASKPLQNSIAEEIARRIKKGEDCDFNAVAKIKNKTGIDIEKLSPLIVDKK